MCVCVCVSHVFGAGTHTSAGTLGLHQLKQTKCKDVSPTTENRFWRSRVCVCVCVSVSQQIHRYRYTQVQRRRQREGILNKSVSFDSKELAARLLQGSRREGAGGEGRSLVLSLTSTSAALGLAPEYATARSFVPLCWAADTAGVGAA